jgi:hydroxyacylglutathione hydrolase
MSRGLKIAGICLIIAVIATGLMFASWKYLRSSGETSSVEATSSADETSFTGEAITDVEPEDQAMPSFKATLIMPGVWDITDRTPSNPAYVDIYLVEGTEKALVIDAGVSGSDLLDFVKTLTGKPIEMVLTHGHGDHIAAVTQFDKVSMSEKDFNLMYNMMMTDFKSSGMKDLKGREVFDLGGCKLEVLALPGHTSGSVVLLDRERQLLFAGDAIGSGSLWMQLPESSSVEEFLDEIRKLEKSLDGLNELKPYLGHNCLMSVKPDKNYITDTRIAAEKIVSGEVTGAPSGRSDFPGSITVAYGQMTDFLYRPGKVLKDGK